MVVAIRFWRMKFHRELLLPNRRHETTKHMGPYMVRYGTSLNNKSWILS
jgi:hypothetical protein